MDKLDQYIQKAVDLAMGYAPKLLMAVIVLIIGLWIIKMVVNGIGKMMKKKGIDDSLQSFLRSMLSILLKVMLVISVVSMLGVEATSFIAVLGAAGLAVGMALSGTLQNFAGGVMLLIFKPFKVGDYIVAQGHEGVVDEIQIFITTLRTLDNQSVFIPNGPLSNESLVNVTRQPTRRVDLIFDIGYTDDIDKARSVIKNEIDGYGKALKDPATDILVSNLAESSVQFETRVWCKTEDYWDVYFEVRENIKKAFDREGISIPFPQRDVHMIPQN